MPEVIVGSLLLPDLALTADVVRDAELALLGVLDDDQLLGGPIPAPPSANSTPATALRAVGRSGATTVRLRLPVAAAEQALVTQAAVLRDEESTPFASLREVEQAEGDLLDGLCTVRGVLNGMRRREGGEARALALSPEDLSASGHRRLVVLARPPVELDGPDVHRLLDDGGGDRNGDGDGQLLVVVPDAPDGDVPASVLLSLARIWLHELGVESHAVLRTAPLAWRDPASDSHLVQLLARAVGARSTVHLAASGSDAATAQWRRTRRALDAGDGGELPSLSPATAIRLRQWRPARADRGLVVMFTGLSGSGKSTLARDLSDWVRAHSERSLTLLDGDVVRQLLSSGLGFDRPSRELNVRRIGFVAAEIARHGGIAVCAPIAPYADTRAAVRRMVEPVGDFVLVHVSTSLEECERRDLKGLYAKARAGLIPEFTGVSDPYEEPADADLQVDTSILSREDALAAVLEHLRRGGWLPGGDE